MVYTTTVIAEMQKKADELRKHYEYQPVAVMLERWVVMLKKGEEK